LLLLSLVLDGFVPAIASCSQLVLQGLVLLLRLLGKLLAHVRVNLVQLCHEPRPFVFISSIIDLSLQTLSLLNMSLVLAKDLPIGQLLNLILDDSVLVAGLTSILTGCLPLNSLLLLAESLF